jgi:hypothetical protein
MPERDDITSVALRVVIDSYEEILGPGGKNSILNYAGLRELIDNQPTYSEEVKYPQAFADRIIRASVEVLGEPGTKAIVVRAGRGTIKHLVENSEPIRQIAQNTDMPRMEKLKLIMNLYAANINRPPLFDFLEEKTVFHNPGCTLCAGVKTERQFCTYVSGMFEGIARYIVGFENARCEEVTCKATGDAECAYELHYEGWD